MLIERYSVENDFTRSNVLRLIWWIFREIYFVTHGVRFVMDSSVSEEAKR